MVTLPPFLIVQPAGVISINLTVPNVPGLAGIALYAQALQFPFQLQARLTNVTAGVIVR